MMLPYVLSACHLLTIIVLVPLFCIVIDPCSRLLLHHRSILFELMLPKELILLLRTEEVISKETQHRIKTIYSVLDSEALIAVCITIAEDHNKLSVLANILLKFGETAMVGKEIIEHYGKFKIL